MSRTIAVTGATGFIGAMLVDHLLAAGWNVNALIMQPIPPQTFFQPNESCSLTRSDFHSGKNSSMPGTHA